MHSIQRKFINNDCDKLTLLLTMERIESVRFGLVWFGMDACVSVDARNEQTQSE